MKKLFSILLSLIFILSCIQLTVFAEESEEAFPIDGEEAPSFEEDTDYEYTEEEDDEYAIYEIQYILKKFGYFTNECTGTLGDLTKAAIKAFQEDTGLEGTGELDTDTKASIRSAGCADAEIKVKTLLYVRSSASTEDDAVDVISRSLTEIIHIYSEKDGWYHIQTDSGMTGFVPTKYLESKGINGISGKTVDVESVANIRKSADTSSEVVATLYNDTELRVIGGSADWFKVDYDGKVGYIFKKYVSIGTEHGAATTIDDFVTKWKGSVKSSSLIVRSGPGTGYDSVTTISKGTTLTIVAESGNWYYVELSSGTKGFVHKDYIQKGSGYSTCTVTGSSLNIRSGPGKDYDVVASASEGAVLTLLDDSSSWYKVKTSGGATGYIDGQYVKLGGTLLKSSSGLVAPSGTYSKGDEGSAVTTIQKRLKELGYFSGSATGYYGSSTVSAVKAFQSRNSLTSNGTCNQKTISKMFSSNAVTAKKASSSSSSGTKSSGTNETAGNDGTATGQAIANYALQFVGRPYVLGGNGPNVFDCSGLTKYVYAHFGISIPRTAYTQGYSGLGTKITSTGNLKVGDLVFFNTLSHCKHVGIYIGNNKFVHAENSSTGVVVTSLSSSYYSKRFIWGRHIV